MTWLDTLEQIRKTDWSQASEDDRRTKASEVVDICSYGGCLASLVPIPMGELAVLIPVHSAMVMTVGHIYGRPMSQVEAKRIALELGAVAGLSFVGTAAIGALKRILLPGIGGVLTIPATFALTWGLGHAAMAYFQNPSLGREDLKSVFQQAVKDGKSVFSRESFERFRDKYRKGSEPSAPADQEKGTGPYTRDSEPPPEAPAENPAPSDPTLKPGKRTL